MAYAASETGEPSRLALGSEILIPSNECDGEITCKIRPISCVLPLMRALVRRMRATFGDIEQAPAWVYFLRLRSGQIYIGTTIKLEQRLLDHEKGAACRTTRMDPPIELLRIEPTATFSAARAREAQLKRWSRAKKEALISGDMTALRRLSRSRGGTK